MNKFKKAFCNEKISQKKLNKIRKKVEQEETKKERNKNMTNKKGKECWVLYVNLTDNYISFKLEIGLNLGELKNNSVVEKGYYVIEHKDDEVNYVKKVDIFKTREEAEKGLMKILKDKYEDVDNSEQE